jgi:hypothetical protein
VMGHKVSTPVLHDKHQGTAQPGSKGIPDSAPEGIILRGTHSIPSSTNTVSQQALVGTRADGQPVYRTAQTQGLTLHASASGLTVYTSVLRLSVADPPGRYSR